MTDPSDRFAETFPCGCETHAGQVFPCAQHATPHSAHTTPAPGCLDCEDALSEARGLVGEMYEEWPLLGDEDA